MSLLRIYLHIIDTCTGIPNYKIWGSQYMHKSMLHPIVSQFLLAIKDVFVAQYTEWVFRVRIQIYAGAVSVSLQIVFFGQRRQLKALNIAPLSLLFTGDGGCRW